MAALFLAPEYEEDLARLGIRDFESAMSFTGGHLVAAHRGRSTVRIDGDLYLKRSPEAAGPLRDERRAMETLAAGPGPDPVPIAAWGEGDRGGFLITVRPAGSMPLPDALRALSGGERRRFVAHVGRRIRALHDRGLTCPDLMAHHLLAGRPDRLYLIDAGRLKARPGRRARARDLAALDLSRPYGEGSDADRVRLLTAYLGARPSLRPGFLDALDAAARKLARRLRHRRDRFVAAPADREFLKGLGIRCFGDLMSYEGGHHLRTLPDRSNWRVEAGDRVFFVKRHGPTGDVKPTPAEAEWNAIRSFRRAGIRAMRGVALGEDVDAGSTIWVEKAPGRPLDDLLRDGVLTTRRRREIVAEVAIILRRMRLCEMHHRDMYLCHLITDPAAAPGERVTVIDLQRARRVRGLRKRWFVKDVAALLHSAPMPPVTRTDGVRFLRRYFGVAKLGRREKKFARKVLAKAVRLGRRGRG